MKSRVYFFHFEERSQAEIAKRKITDHGHTAMVCVLDPRVVQLSDKTYRNIIKEMGVLSDNFSGMTKVESELAEKVGSAP